MASSGEAIETHEEEVNKIRTKIDKMEDEIYRDFCSQIGVANIRCDLCTMHNQKHINSTCTFVCIRVCVKSCL